jgi:hypothetical protein
MSSDRKQAVRDALDGLSYDDAVSTLKIVLLEYGERFCTDTWAAMHEVAREDRKSAKRRRAAA